MKSFSLLCFFALFACASAVQLTPTTRIVELLKGLSKQIEAEGKKEEDLYETYVCWAKSIISQKTASNAEAASKIDSLETYLSDLANGRVEMTSERADLEKEIEELLADLESAKALRNQEKKDFEEAEDEMKKAISALDSAIKVLGSATKDHKEGVLLAVRASLNGGMQAVLQEQVALKHAVDLGEKFLTKGDALFLRRVLLGDVPDVDWKKLNRKATFKMAYKARSFKIQDVLKKMHQTFEINLKEAEDKEKESKDQYKELKKAKSGQLDAAKTALTKMESEGGARGKSKADSEDELKDLKEQKKNDEKFISQTEKDLETKKTEWKERLRLRSGELQAISKAVSILYNDDARDLFKKSFDSQVSFIQTVSKSTRAHSGIAKGATKALRDALRSGDSRVASILKLVADPSVKLMFKPVIAAIDKLVLQLKGEEESDRNIKDGCEKDRMADTREAILASREMDDMTDKISKLDSEIAQLAEEIKALLAEKKETKEELDEAQKNRDEENKAWKKTDADDKLAAETVMDAKLVLEKFYKDEGLSMVQLKHKQPFESTAGEAPPPPPPTWDATYGGKTGETSGILSIMEMVHEDIVKDRTTAKSEEDASAKEFSEFKKDAEAQMKSLQEDADKKSGTKGDKEDEKGNTEISRTGKAGELSAVMQKMEGAAPNCEYFAVNYPLRLKNRQLEMDGLTKAKAILLGGAFDAGPDPDREIKPGDAFLQKRA